MDSLVLTNPEPDIKTQATSKDTQGNPGKSDEEDSEIYLEGDEYKPKEKDSIIRKPIHKAKGKKKYHNISNDMRLRLIDLVENQGIKIKHAAKKLGINYSSAKSICQIFKREGRTNKKVFKKSYEIDDSTPDNEEYSLSLLSSKEESEASSTKRSQLNQDKEAQENLPAKKIEISNIQVEQTTAHLKSDETVQVAPKLGSIPTASTVEILKVSPPLQTFTTAINQAKSDNISPNKLILDKRIVTPQMSQGPIYYKPNQSMYSYSPSSAPIIIQQSNFSPYQGLNYSTPGFIRQVTPQQNQLSDQLSIYQTTQSQNQPSETGYQAQQIMPQASVIVVGNNYQQQLSTPYIVTSNPNLLGGQQVGGYQVMQPVICVMPQQTTMMMGYQQNLGQDSNMMIQQQQIQPQILQHQQNYGINNLYQNLGYGKPTSNIQYILMRNAEDQQLLQKK